MPNWDPYLLNALGGTSYWLSVSDLQTKMKASYKDAWDRAHPGRVNSNYPKPSAPTVQGLLIRKLAQRTVVAKLGTYGAAYFLSMDNFTRSGSGCRPRFPSRNYALRRRCNNFNDSVDVAIRDRTPLPNPWHHAERVATAAVPPAPVPDPTGGITPEALSIINRLFPEQRTDRWNEYVEGILNRIPTDMSREIIQRIGNSNRSFLTQEDIGEVLLAALDTLAAKVAERGANRPKNLESEFFDRLTAKGERLD